MGQITPNMSIFIPADGEQNYGSSFAAGMVNVDQHDHSGGPNKGVPLSSASLGPGSVTFDKLNANVADTTTGIGTFGALGANQLSLEGLVQSLYKLSTDGIIINTGAVASSIPFVEGTWTPTIFGSTTAVTYAANGQYGIYQRIGNWVDCYAYIHLASSTMTGPLKIGGFPFAFKNAVSNFTIGQVDVGQDVATPPSTVGGTAPYIRAVLNTTTARLLFYNSTTGTDDDYNSATFPATGSLSVKIRYLIN